MPHLSPMPAKKLIAMLVREGFACVRIRGSHHYFLNEITKKTTVVPVHGSRDVGVGLLRTILRDIDMSIDDLNRLWNKEILC